MPRTEFTARVDTLIRDLRSGETAEGVERILVPGELERERRRTREASGVPLPTALREEVNGYAAELGVPGLD
ncbi:Ldh family oxidoreductase [Streptomycetaceae bacterium NBC_01309]